MVDGGGRIRKAFVPGDGRAIGFGNVPDVALGDARVVVLGDVCAVGRGDARNVALGEVCAVGPDACVRRKTLGLYGPSGVMNNETKVFIFDDRDVWGRSGIVSCIVSGIVSGIVSCIVSCIVSGSGRNKTIHPSENFFPADNF
jgi:hypothetical protein